METSATTNSTAPTVNTYAGYANTARGVQPVAESAQTPESEKAWKAAKQVEAVFLGMLLKEMEKTVEKGSLFHGGVGEDMFQAELDNAYVDSFANGADNGIARLYYEQMMRSNPVDAAKARGIIKSGFIPLVKENAALPLAHDEAQFLPLDKDRLAPKFIPLKSAGF